MRRAIIRLAACAALCDLAGALSPRTSLALGLLLENLARLPGVAAEGMAGAQAALALGPSAVALNPAGLSRVARSEVLLDAQVIEWTDWNEGTRAASSVRVASGAAGWSSGPGRNRPRLGYGVLLGPSQGQSANPVFLTTANVTGAALPPNVAGTLNYDSLFSGGITQSERRETFAQLESFPAMAGFGLRLSDWARAGASMRVERVSLRLREILTRDFSAAPSGSPNVLAGYALGSVEYSGSVDRAVLVIGTQLELAPSIVLGIVARLPSETLGGAGSVRWERSEYLLVTQGGSVLQEASARIHAANEAAPFDLRAPGAWRIGLAFLSDSTIYALDWERSQYLAPYTVFPRVDSQPPSTAAATFPALRAEGQESSSFAFGAAMALGDRSTVMFGVATLSAAAPPGDPVFRAMTLNRVSGAYYFTSGAASAAFLTSYAAGESPQSVEPITGTESAPRPARFTQWSLAFSGGWTY